MRRRSGGVHVLVRAGLALAAARAPAGAGEAPGVLRIYLARHGETDWNRAHRLQGQVDTELNERGREQAADLARRLSGVSFARVYASTLARSLETAEIARGGAPLAAVPALRERGLGAFEDLCLDGSEPVREAAWRRRQGDPGPGPDGVEPEAAFFARVRAFALDLIARHRPGENVLVVGHGYTNRMLVRALLELDPAQAEGIRQANDEVFLIEVAPGRPGRLWSLVDPSRLAAR